MNFCFCMLPCLLWCTLLSISTYLQSAVWAWRGRDQHRRESPCQFPCLFVFPSSVTLLPRSTDQRTDTCPNVVSPLLSSISGSYSSSILTLSLCHSPFRSILSCSFLPDYISGDFDSITAEVKAFYADKVSGIKLADTGIYSEAIWVLTGIIWDAEQKNPLSVLSDLV